MALKGPPGPMGYTGRPGPLVCLQSLGPLPVYNKSWCFVYIFKDFDHIILLIAKTAFLVFLSILYDGDGDGDDFYFRETQEVMV